MTIDCASVREHAPDLALDILSGGERAEMLDHLAFCAGCQAVVDEYIDVADLLPHLAPDLEPPPGFESRVARAMRPDRRRATRRLVAAVAVAAAAATITSVAAIRVIEADSTDDRVASAPSLRTVRMMGADGLPVGRVTVSNGSPAALVVSVDYAVPDGAYTLELRAKHSSADEVGTITIADGRGEWSGRAVIPTGTRSTLALVGASGTTVCTADIPN